MVGKPIHSLMDVLNDLTNILHQSIRLAYSNSRMQNVSSENKKKNSFSLSFLFFIANESHVMSFRNISCMVSQLGVLNVSLTFNNIFFFFYLLHFYLAMILVFINGENKNKKKIFEERRTVIFQNSDIDSCF